MVSTLKNFIYDQSVKVKYSFDDPKSYVIASPFVSSVIQICKIRENENLIQKDYTDIKKLKWNQKICYIHFAVCFVIWNLLLLYANQNKASLSSRVFVILNVAQSIPCTILLFRELLKFNNDL